MKDIILIRQQFNDFDHLLEVAPKWSLNFKQLDKGRFSGELMMVDLDEVQIGLSSFSRKFDQEGNTPSGYRTIALLSSMDQQIIWRGQKVTGKNLLVFPESGEVIAVSNPGFKVYTISIANNIVQQYLEQECIDEKKMSIPNEGIVTPGNRFIKDIRHKLEYLTRIIHTNPNLG